MLVNSCLSNTIFNKQTGKAMLKGGAYSFALAWYLKGNLLNGALFGGVAASASIAHAMTKPIFRKVCATNLDPKEAHWYQELPRVLACRIAVGFIWRQLTPFAFEWNKTAAIVTCMFMFADAPHYSINKTRSFLLF